MFVCVCEVWWRLVGSTGVKQGMKWEEEGRVYTLKKATPEGAATVSAHPGTLRYFVMILYMCMCVGVKFGGDWWGLRG